MLKRAKDVVSSEVHSMLDEAEARTPNYDDFARREYFDIETNPKHLSQGDVVVAVEHDRKHSSIEDIANSQAFRGTVFSVDRRNELVVLLPGDGSGSGMETVSFSEARFFKEDELNDFLQDSGGSGDKKPRRSKPKGGNRSRGSDSSESVRREDMEDNVIYDAEIID